MPETPNSEIEGFLRAHGPFEKPPILSCGERVGDWTIRAFLGRGGSAEVFRAENVVTGIVGALKVLYRTDDRSRERFRREARIIAETRGAAFPLFYGAGECDGRFYIAEELLEPIALPADDAAVARYIFGVAAGVEVLHRRGFVHRDLKPGNVLMRPATGESVLIDMGLAKGGEDAPQMHGEPLSVVDGHAVGVGTPGFSAPEQFTGGKVSAATDIHALGVLVDACFKGKPPKAWADIIRRSTSSIPGQRYANVAEFVRAVRRRHSTRHWIAAIAVVLFIAGVTIGVEAVKSIIGGDYRTFVFNNPLALIAAVTSIVVKEAMFWYTKINAKRIDSPSLSAEAWHHRSDALSSVGALIGIGGAALGFPILEPIASIVICLFIFKVAFDVFKDAVDRMVDHSCDEETEAKIKACAEEIEGVEQIDLLRTRVFGNKIYVDIEIGVDSALSVCTAHGIAEKVHDAVEDGFPQVKHVMVHVNPLIEN